MDRGAWQATVHRVTKSRTQLKRLGTAHIGAFQVLLVVKNSPAKAGNLRDAGSIPGSGSPGRPLCIYIWSLGQEDPLEEEMATHSSILAWRIPWTEEPGGLQSRGLQRVGQD